MADISGTVTIRDASAGDAEPIARLSGQLGYPEQGGRLGKRLSALLGSSLDAVYVAEVDGSVVGWIHVFASVRIESAARAEIGGLVVDEAYRGKGIGERLVREVETWAIQHGLAHIRVRTRATRTEAHGFYAREGFERTKLQHVLDKEIG